MLTTPILVPEAFGAAAGAAEEAAEGAVTEAAVAWAKVRAEKAVLSPRPRARMWILDEIIWLVAPLHHAFIFMHNIGNYGFFGVGAVPFAGRVVAPAGRVAELLVAGLAAPATGDSALYASTNSLV